MLGLRESSPTAWPRQPADVERQRATSWHHQDQPCVSDMARRWEEAREWHAEVTGDD
jgi:hypothetical protein